MACVASGIVAALFAAAGALAAQSAPTTSNREKQINCSIWCLDICSRQNFRQRIL